VASLAERCLGGRVERLAELTPGLGTRRFFRVTLTGAEVATLMARVEPRPAPAPDAHGNLPEPPLEPLLGFLEAHGLPVPAHYGGDSDAGIELLEDLGDLSLERAANTLSAADRRRLYELACAIVPKLQGLRAPADTVPAFGRLFDRRLIASKAQKFVAWTLPEGLGRAASQAERSNVEGAFDYIAQRLQGAPLRLAHRDFKAANLHLRGADPRANELVMIDVQGAFLAPPEYDLVCLLRDSHVRLPESEVQTHLEQTQPSLPEPSDPETFAERFDLLTLVRVAKDVSHYLHAARERGDRRYLRWVPTGLANLRAAASRAAQRAAELDRLASLIHAIPPDLGSDVDADVEPTCGQ
jgi:aminoglycoside/choline kinase family phosphotransferase